MASTHNSIDPGATLELYASCPEGFEIALADELRNLGLRAIRRLKGRVTFTGGLADAYRACLWSRLASRIFVTIARFDCRDADDLYAGAHAVPWENILAPGATFAVSSRGVTDELRNSHFSALRVKDALCDRLTEVAGRRPDVDVDDPDARILLSLRGERASLSLDLTGDPLFKRLPREATREHGAHVLRPDYAALVLSQIDWQGACANAVVNAGEADTAEGAAFPVLVDPCCAGGGIVLEAARILADEAPGIHRTHWGFAAWTQHDEVLWQELRAEALTRAEAARARAGRIVATDLSGDAVACARRVLKAAGVSDRVILTQPDAPKMLRKLSIPVISGAAIAGGMALDTTELPLTKIPRLLSLLGGLRGGGSGSGGIDESASNALGSLPMAALTRDSALEQALGASARELSVMPNNEDAQIIVFDGARREGVDGEEQGAANTTATIDLGSGKPCPVLIPESEQFARRLRKVTKQRRKWAQREGITCYRVYDADLPDYSAAIDLYEGRPETPGRWLVIAEYAAPRQVDPALAEARLLDILTIAPRILDVDPENVFAKARIRSRGGSQYGKQAGGFSAASKNAKNGARGNANKGGRGAQGSGAGAPSDIRTRRLPLIEEGGLTFAVNFNDYLDTGIFLDHRITRGLVREHARGKRFFLNLFAYTGTATCYAADAGVEETVTVDLSNTYLDWAERNMEQNGFVGPDHHYVRADVMSWIRDMRATRNRWDLIFCDPPTFSNSSKMGRRTWDVQRDHVELLIGLSRLLSREGEAIFSCNLRTFRPDIEELARAGVVLTDITAQTIPEDFSRNQRIHHCYLVRRYTSEEAMRMVGMDEDAIRERTLELRENAQRRPR